MNPIKEASTAVLEEEKNDALKTHNAGEKKEEESKRMFDMLAQQSIAQYRRALEETDSITQRDFREHTEYLYSDEKWNALGKDTYAKRVEMIRATVQQWNPEMLSKHKELDNIFYSTLAEAVSKNWISKESETEWRQRLKSDAMTHFEKEAFIKQKFIPEYVKNWKDVAEKRVDVVKLVEKHGLTAKDIPELGSILSLDAFHSLHYLSRKDQIAKVNALVIAHINRKTNFIRFIESELQDWAKAGYMHKAKIGEWMERVMKSKDPEEFAAKILYPYKENWKEIKEGSHGFDALHKAMWKQGVPRGLKPCTEEEFLLMNYKQRTSYVNLTWIRLEGAAEDTKKLAGSKMYIRHCLDTKDWNSAEEVLGELSKEWPEDRELLSMKTYIEHHKPKEVEMSSTETVDNKGQVLVQECRDMMKALPPALHRLAVRAAQDGCFDMLSWMMYNRVWVHEHGYSTQALDARNAHDERNKEATRHLIETGEKTSINHILDGDTAQQGAIVDDCTRPQVIHMGSMGTDATHSKISKNRENWGFGYWTTLVPDDVPYNLHARFVKTIFYPLKQKLRELDKIGYKFTTTGTAELKSGQHAKAELAETTT